MNRRSLLSGMSLSLAGPLAGCITLGSNRCAGETWTGLGFDVRLDEISYVEESATWEGECSLSVYFSFVHDDGPGITDAGIGIYSEAGHLLELISFGDLTWADVPEENRSEMDCGGYERGGVTRRDEFAVDAFPYHLGLWYGAIRAGAPEGRTALTYGDGTPPNGTEPVGDWRPVEQTARGTFPPVPDRPPELGDGIEAAELASFHRECQGSELRFDEVRCCEVGLAGAIEATNPQHVPGVSRATLSEDGATARVEIDVRDYQRPPEASCETGALEYVVGLSFTDEPPGRYEVVHRDVDGTELRREVLGRDDA